MNKFYGGKLWVHRKIFDQNHYFSQSEKGIEARLFFLVLFSLANYKDEVVSIFGENYLVKRGQLIINNCIMKKLIPNFSRQKYRTCLQYLQEIDSIKYVSYRSSKCIKMLKRQATMGATMVPTALETTTATTVITTPGTIVTIENYSKYQETKNDEKNNNNQASNHIKNQESKRQANAEQPCLLYRTNNVNNYKKYKEKIYKKEISQNDDKAQSEKINFSEEKKLENAIDEIFQNSEKNKISKKQKRNTKKDWTASHKFANVFSHLCTVNKFKLVFDLKKDEKKLEGLQTEYGLTIPELERISWEFAEWSEDAPKAIKSPRGTFRTFCKNHSEKKNQKNYSQKSKMEPKALNGQEIVNYFNSPEYQTAMEKAAMRASQTEEISPEEFFRRQKMKNGKE